MTYEIFKENTELLNVTLQYLLPLKEERKL